MGDEGDRQYIIQTRDRLLELMCRAYEARWRHSEPHRLPSGAFLTLSLLSEEELARRLSPEQLAEIKVNAAGEIEIEIGKPLPLYTIVHRSEVLFEEPVTEERRVKPTAKGAVAIAVDREINEFVREAHRGGRPGVLDRVLILASRMGSEIHAPSEAGELAYRRAARKYGDIEVRRCLVGVEDEEFRAAIFEEFHSVLRERARKAHSTILTLSKEETEAVKNIMQAFIDKEGLSEEEIEPLKTHAHLIQVEIGLGAYLNEGQHVVLVKCSHDLLRFHTGEIEADRENIILLARAHSNLLRSMIKNKDILPREINEFNIEAYIDTLNEILKGAVPIKSLAVAERAQQIKEQYEQIIRSL